MERHKASIAGLIVLIILAVTGFALAEYREVQQDPKIKQESPINCEQEIKELKAHLGLVERQRDGFKEANLRHINEKRKEIEILERQIEGLKAKKAKAKVPTYIKSNPVTVSKAGWNVAKASWYGPGFYSTETWTNHTANGTIYTPQTWGFAHKAMKFGTKVEFEVNGKKAVAPCIDRGPYVPGRTFDFSGAMKTHFGVSGVFTVKWRVVK